MDKAASVRISHNRSATGNSRESSHYRVSAVISMVLLPNVFPRRLPFGNSCQERSPFPGRGHNLSPSPFRVLETVGLAPEGDQLVNTGLSTEVVETILNGLPL